MTEDTFHLGVKALITNRTGEILLFQVNPAALQNNREPYWDLPGGRVQQGDDQITTLKREVEEESGITEIESISHIGMALSNIRIPLKDGTDVGLILSIYRCKVAPEVEPRLSEEHIEFAWFSPQEAAEKLAVKYPKEFTTKISTDGTA